MTEKDMIFKILDDYRNSSTEILKQKTLMILNTIKHPKGYKEAVMNSTSNEKIINILHDLASHY